MADGARDRARGALVGLACGDAVGTTVEFSKPGTFEPLTDMVGGGPFSLDRGNWTDDTSMALCLAESIVDQQGMDLADQLRRYCLWHDTGYFSARGGCFDIGSTTRHALRRFQKTGMVEDDPVRQEAAANGSLMRLAPVPIAWHRDPAAVVAQSARSSVTTHGAARPVDACKVMGAMTAALIRGETWQAVTDLAFWQWGDLDPEIAAIVAGSYREKSPPAIKGTGFCVDALEAALWAVDGATTFREAILRAANLGDDADTTAAIAGQLAGARWGLTGTVAVDGTEDPAAIPRTWRHRISLGDRIVSLADALFDLHRPAQVAPESWPHDAPMHAWWVTPGALLAGEYPATLDMPRTGPGTSGHAPAKVDILMDHGIRSFVDLTCDGELTPYEQPLLEQAGRRGLDVRYRRFPITDMGTIELAGYREIVDHITSEIAEGRPVFVHCWGGVGRTGTVVGCYLLDTGCERSQVLDRITALRTGTRKASRPSPETQSQRIVIQQFLPTGPSSS